MLLTNIRSIALLNMGVEDALRLHYNVRTLLTKAVTASKIHFNICQPQLRYLSL